MAEWTIPIRRATAADVPGLARLAREAFCAKFGHLYPAEVLGAYVAETYSEAATAALVHEATVWLAGDAGRLAGFAVLGPCKLPHPDVTAGCVELRRLYTAPERTGQGLGAGLMEAVVLPAFAAARGGDAWVGVYSGNEGAQRFYARYGFVKVGEYEFLGGPVRDREFILRRRR